MGLDYIRYLHKGRFFPATSPTNAHAQNYNFLQLHPHETDTLVIVSRARPATGFHQFTLFLAEFLNKHDDIDG